MMRRIQRARALLEATAHPLAQIAFDLGFVSQNHFTSVFHREMRVTPQALSLPRHEGEQQSISN